jgi:hypothetical protein
VTMTTIATDNVGVASVTFFYTYTVNGVKQTGTVIGTKTTTANQWTGSFVPSVAASYTFTAVASDNANQTTSAPTTKSIVR